MLPISYHCQIEDTTLVRLHPFTLDPGLSPLSSSTKPRRAGTSKIGNPRVPSSFGSQFCLKIAGEYFNLDLYDLCLCFRRWSTLHPRSGNVTCIPQEAHLRINTFAFSLSICRTLLILIQLSQKRPGVGLELLKTIENNRNSAPWKGTIVEPFCFQNSCSNVDLWSSLDACMIFLASLVSPNHPPPHQCRSAAHSHLPDKFCYKETWTGGHWRGDSTNMIVFKCNGSTLGT